MTRYLVVRRWRAGCATLTIHLDGCPGSRRADKVTYLHATSRIHAGVKATTMLAGELTVGLSHWGAECARCTV